MFTEQMVHCCPTLSHFLPPVNPPGPRGGPSGVDFRPPSTSGSTGSPTRTRPGSTTAACTPKGSGSVVSTCAPVGRERLQRVEIGAPGLGALGRDDAAADVPLRDDDGRPRPRPCGRASRPRRAARGRRSRSSSGTGARRPASTPSTVRERLERRRPEQRRRAATAAIGRPVAAARRAGPARPTSSESASAQGPRRAARAAAGEWKRVSTSSPRSTCAADDRAVGQCAASARRPARRTRRARAAAAPQSLLLTRRPVSSTRKNRRSPRDRSRAARSRRRARRASAFTGVSEIQATRPVIGANASCARVRAPPPITAAAGPGREARAPPGARRRAQARSRAPRRTNRPRRRCRRSARPADRGVGLAVRRASVRAVGQHDGPHVERAVVALAGVVHAADEQVERDACLAERRQLADRRREEARRSGRTQHLGLARDEEHEVVAVERQRAVRQQLVAEHGDRPLALAVDVRPRAPGLAAPLDVHVDAELGQPPLRTRGRARRCRAP